MASLCRRQNASASAQLDVVEVGERAGRQHLEVDVRLAHPGKSQFGIGERASRVLDADELVIADAIPRLAIFVGAEFRAVTARCAVGRLQPHMGMHVDDRGVADSHGRGPYRTFRLARTS